MRSIIPTIAIGVLCAATSATGCAPEEPACALAEVREDGWVPIVEPSDRPFTVGEIRRVVCVRGIAPCDEATPHPTSGDESVLSVLRDAPVPWVHLLAAVGTGRVELRQRCGPGDEASYVLEVR